MLISSYELFFNPFSARDLIHKKKEPIESNRFFLFIFAILEDYDFLLLKAFLSNPTVGPPRKTSKINRNSTREIGLVKN